MVVGGVIKVEGVESHASDPGSGVVKAHAIEGMVAERVVGVAEVTIVHIRTPTRHHLVEVVGDASRRALLGEVGAVESTADSKRIGDVIQGRVHAAPGSFTAPGLAESLQAGTVHPSVGAVSMQEEPAPQLDLVFVAAELGSLLDESIEGGTKRREAIVIAQDVVDFAPGELIDQVVQPNQGRRNAGIHRGKLAPVEVKRVAVQDEDVGMGHCVVHVREEAIPFGTARKQMKIGDDQAAFHIGITWWEGDRARPGSEQPCEMVSWPGEGPDIDNGDSIIERTDALAPSILRSPAVRGGAGGFPRREW